MDLSGNPSCGGFDDGQGVKNKMKQYIVDAFTN